MGNSINAQKNLQFVLGKIKGSKLSLDQNQRIPCLSVCAINKGQPNLSARNKIHYPITLDSNNICAEGVFQLTEGVFQNLTTLNLNSNNIRIQGVKYLVNAHFHYLTELNLSFNKIGTQGLRHLVNGPLQGLETLNLNYNRINDDGAQLLMKADFKNLVRITLLKSHFTQNKYLSQGFKYLACGHHESLIVLDIRFNEMFRELKDQFPKYKLVNNKGTSMDVLL